MTRLHDNVALIDRHRALWKERDEWDICESISTKGLIDALIARIPDMGDDEWITLHDAVLENV